MVLERLNKIRKLDKNGIAILLQLALKPQDSIFLTSLPSKNDIFILIFIEFTLSTIEHLRKPILNTLTGAS
jgi:hypothetical protein